jgi:predicted permease
VLVSGQLAVAVLLLSGAGLLFRSFVKLKSVEPGFRAEGLITFRAATKRPGGPEGEESWQAWDLVLNEVRSVPGLQAVAGMSNPPFQSPYWAPWVLLPGDALDLRREGITGYSVTPGYLDAVGTRLLRGRDIEARDGRDAPMVALVNEAFIADQLGGGDALGVQLRMTGGGGGEPELVPVEIVGVVENVVQTRAEEGAKSAVYIPYTHADWAFVQVAVRTERPAEQVIPELRRAVARFNPVAPLMDVRTMEDRMAATRTDPRFQALLLGTFSLVALLLAAAGLYASLAHAVGRRSRELGIRMALGAERAGVLRMVLLQGMRVAAAGLIVGVAGAMAMNRVLRTFLFEVEPADPATLGGVTFLLAAVAAAASFLPARRATRVDPVEVLKSD